MKASGKSSFTTFVDLGMYQAPGGTGDNMSVGGVVIVCTACMINYLILICFKDAVSTLSPSLFDM